ncbi:mitochondrial 37S ribosomal protein [Maudiozyma humilis]|uniref:Small ribosomal subunit protein uS10m n=1 Tax=Maudiozyma humilis TaxID=51915 RepID=A0AAV5S5M6_MAUHU|nr:mitochondrial 37S ribosomal protein [Kazachstania humilis]
MLSKACARTIGARAFIRPSAFSAVRLQSTVAANAANPASTATPTPNLYPDTTPQEDTQGEKPVLKSLEALYQPPMRIPVTHGHLVADIQLRSYEHQNLDFFVNFVQRAAFYLGVPMTGPKPLPTRRERWTVIRSPFVHAKSKENFERHTHKRLLRVWDTNPEVLELLVSYVKKHSMVGIGMKVNAFKREPIKIDFDKDEGLPEGLANFEPNTGDDAVNAKVLELLNSPEFKK